MNQHNDKIVYTTGALWETWGPAPFDRLGTRSGFWRYSVRESVDALLGHSVGEYLNEYLFEYAAEEHEVYLRAPRARAIRGLEWRLMPELTAAAEYRVLGALAFNLAHMQHGVPDWFQVQAGREDWVRGQLEHSGLVVDTLDTWVEREPMRSAFLPVGFEAHSRVNNVGRARHAMRHGIGKMRRFGFGVLHFHPVNRQDAASHA